MTMLVFGYLILISINFTILFLTVFSLLLVSIITFIRYTKHSRQYLTTFPITSKFFKNTLQRVFFSTLLSVLGDVVKRSLSCLIYYFKCHEQCKS